MNSSIMKYLKASCLGCALITQSLIAGPIALGPNYSTFDNLIIIGLGTTDIENCDHLLNAIANTSGARTIKLPPATYDCTTDQVNVPDNVTIEGSGQKNTIIKAAPNSGQVVVLSNGSELKHLTVENNLTSGPNTTVVTSITIDGVGNRLTHVAVVSEGSNAGENVGVLLSGLANTTTLNDVTVRVDNSMLFNEGIRMDTGGEAILNNVNILALDTPGITQSSCGIFNTFSGSIIIRNSVINGATEAIFNNSVETPTYSITHTQLVNGVTSGGGTFNCFGVFDENHSALTTGCATPL